METTRLPSAAERMATIAIGAIAVAVLLVAIARTAKLSWSPIGNNATTWLRAWDVGSRYTPLLGPTV